MAWVAPVLSLAGTAMSMSGQQQSAAASSQASLYNASMVQAKAKSEQEYLRRDAAANMGQIHAARAKSGVTIEGTPLLVLGESAANAEIDALNTQWSANTTSELYKMQAGAATTAGNIGAGTSLLSGASSFFGG